ncbi:Peptidase S8 S53 subtilisin kexin sedolisin [Fusarium albosuccineum]|uniref:Peptidase S8 S53 subtilisin kexin sedolisin n=1 Tax=Fusarium albosuccineum TaxID=1237068 RepID=A0A8H4PHU3_9HYPO|nr:Peptidase S8 S53 subtilisin kexin sedolisin [Fusarium albosuccineum]
MCSTSDEGENTDKVWPAAFHTTDESVAERFDNVFPIVGCDEHGKPSRFANDREGMFFFFRGEDIDASGTDAGLLKEREAVLGSSVATAIATGIGSLVLACYHMIPQDTRVDPTGVVSAVFHKMLSRSDGTHNKSLGSNLVMTSKFFPTHEDDLLDNGQFRDLMKSRYGNGK